MSATGVDTDEVAAAGAEALRLADGHRAVLRAACDALRALVHELTGARACPATSDVAEALARLATELGDTFDGLGVDLLVAAGAYDEAETDAGAAARALPPPVAAAR